MNCFAAFPHRARARERRVQIVQQEHVDPAIEGAGGRSHIRFDRLGRTGWGKRSLDREIDQRKCRRRLRLAVFDDFEVVSREVAHERTHLVGDDRVNLDEIGLGPEGDGRLLRGTQWRTREHHERQDPGTAHRISSASG
jgi:hypothetical protein